MDTANSSKKQPRVIKAIIIHPDGLPEPIVFEDGLESMQKLVGGYLERVAFDEDLDAWVDEEGLLKQLPHNFSVAIERAPGEFAKYKLHGPVLFTSHDRAGNTTSLTLDQAQEIIANLVGLRVVEMRQAAGSSTHSKMGVA